MANGTEAPVAPVGSARTRASGGLTRGQRRSGASGGLGPVEASTPGPRGLTAVPLYSRAHPPSLHTPACAFQAGRRCNKSGENGGGYRRLGGLGQLGRRGIQAQRRAGLEARDAAVGHGDAYGKAHGEAGEAEQRIVMMYLVMIHRKHHVFGVFQFSGLGENSTPPLKYAPPLSRSRLAAYRYEGT